MVALIFHSRTIPFMNHDILPNREASRKGSIFDFKAELAARLPVYKAATSATLAQSVEMFCSG